MKPTGNTILVTGGTSGIGRGLAEALHAKGNHVVVAGRRQNLLDEVVAAHPGMEGIAVDLDDPVALRDFATEVAQRFPDLNVLFNNAGISRPENLLDDADTAVAEAIIRTNIVSVLQLTTALLPTLRRQETSTIVTTTSGLAFLPLAGFPTYCASKAFLHSWLQSLRFQLRDTPVEVLELPPPYVQTELSGPSQASDPNAMPLTDYVAEVISLLETGDFPDGEILVERVKEMRFAERNGVYDQVYAAYHRA